MISTAHEHILFEFKNLDKNIPATSCYYLPYSYIMINIMYEHKLFKSKNLNKNIPASSCLFLSIHVYNLPYIFQILKKFNMFIPVT